MLKSIKSLKFGESNDMTFPETLIFFEFCVVVNYKRLGGFLSIAVLSAFALK